MSGSNEPQLPNTQTGASGQPGPATGQPGLAYRTPADALEAVRKDFHYWTERLTSSSFELSIALIGANWAVFGSVDRILNNWWSKGSLVAVFLSLGIGLVGAKAMSEKHRHQFEKAEADPGAWARVFQKTLGHSDPWPFTESIESWGKFLRWCKVWLPLVGGTMFVVGLLVS